MRGFVPSQRWVIERYERDWQRAGCAMEPIYLQAYHIMESLFLTFSFYRLYTSSDLGAEFE